MSFSSDLPSHWRWVTLEDVQRPGVRAIVSGPFGSNIGSRFFVEKGVPVIRGNNLSTDMTRFIDRGFVFVTEEKAAELRNCDAIPGDLIFTAAGTLGQVGLIPRDARYRKYVISNKQMRVRLDTNLVDELFAFYWLSSPEMVQYIQQRNTGSSVPLINLSILRRLPLPLPPLAEQREIARILGALDDKIELNRQMNATLEATARAIFKSWFVDFDPVHAKASGEQPVGMDAEIAALFPDSFEDCALGAIPAGWRVGTVADIADITSGKRPKNRSSEASENLCVPLYGGGGVMGYVEESLLVSDALLTGRVGTLGRIFRISPPVWASDNTLVITTYEESFYDYLYFHLQTVDFISLNRGSTQPLVTQTDVKQVQLIIPPDIVLWHYQKLVSDAFTTITMDAKQSHTLAELRDALLPKLISGEIRVGETNLV